MESSAREDCTWCINTKILAFLFVQAQEIRDLYVERYSNEKLVKVVDEIPLVRDNSRKHFVKIGGFGVHSSGKRAVVVATIDNLLKGAATQALQVGLARRHFE
jgi:N-acetyl-gamma-glutamylphosphate reductase